MEKKQPLKNEEAEQALLGALLYNNAAYERVSDFLKSEHFSNNTHAKIYEAISFLIESGQTADPITLHHYFSQIKSLENIEKTTYLSQLIESVISIINTADYGETIYDLYLRRELINLGEEVINNAHQFKLETNAIDQIEEIEKKLFTLASTGRTETNIIKFSRALDAAINSAELAFHKNSNVVGVTSGLIDLDKRLGGFHPSDLLILAGRPSMGKTGLATSLAFNAAEASLNSEQKEGAKVLFFSLEMSSEQLATRLLAQNVSISSDKIRRGELAHNDFPKFTKARQKLIKLPLFIDDTPALSVSKLRTRARRLKREHSIGMIIIDYLQLLQPNSKKNHTNNRVQEISEISRSLKALAKELNIPIIALSQLSRAVEQRDNKRPQLSDLRESGSIEQDADVVMFIYREEYYESRKAPIEGTKKHAEWQKRMDKLYKQADIIIAKQRHGPIGTIKLRFEGSLIRFDNLL